MLLSNAMKVATDLTAAAVTEAVEEVAKEGGSAATGVLFSGGKVLVVVAAGAVIGYVAGLIYKRVTTPSTPDVPGTVVDPSKASEEVIAKANKNATETWNAEMAEEAEKIKKTVEFANNATSEELQKADIDEPQLTLIIESREYTVLKDVEDVTGIGKGTILKLRRAAVGPEIAVVPEPNEGADPNEGAAVNA